MIENIRRAKSFKKRMEIFLSGVMKSPNTEVEAALRFLGDSTEIGADLLEVAALAAFVASPSAIELAGRALEKCRTPSQYPSAIAVMIFSGVGGELDRLLDSPPPMSFMNKFQLAWILDTFANRQDLAAQFSKEAFEEAAISGLNELAIECINKWNSTPRMPQYDSSPLRFHYAGSSFDWYGKIRI
jgi:hypothetical protein